MEYSVLTIGVSQELYRLLQLELAAIDGKIVAALGVEDGVKLFAECSISMVVADLRTLEKHNRVELLAGLRRTRFIPIFAIADYSDTELVGRMLDCGVDVCQARETPPILLAKQAKAILRRYTAYNHFDQLAAPETAPFQLGDIFIDPLRRTVQVRDEPVDLRPREFALLLHFMRNPTIVLTTGQIREHAWGREEGYDYSVGQAVSELRKQIEADTSCPVYIQTVYRVGYRFTAHKSETCDRE